MALHPPERLDLEVASYRGWTDALRSAGESAERRAIWVFGGVTALYFAATLLISAFKPFWTDEFFSIYLARIPAAGSLATALGTGGDQHPLPFYRLIRLFMAIFGENEIGVRLPSILACFAGCAGLYFFVARRTSKLFGIVAFIFPLITEAYKYAYEARGYALLFGGAGLAVFFWDDCADPKRRKAAIPGLALSLLLASASHYYAVFLVAPFALAQSVRSWRLRKRDLAVWVAIGCAVIPAVLSLPIVWQTRKAASHFWAIPKWGDAYWYFQTLLEPAIVPLFAFVALLGLLLASSSILQHAPRALPWRLPAEDVVLIVAFTAMPLFILLAAGLVTNAFSFRYAIAGAIGPAMLISIMLHRAFGGQNWVALGLILSIALWLPIDTARTVRRFRVQRRDIETRAALIKSQNPGGLPVVFGDYESLMSLWYYGSPALHPQLIYLVDPRRSVHYLGQFTVDFSAIAMNPWFHMNVPEYAGFVRDNRQFLMYTDLQKYWRWQVRALVDDGLRPEILAQDGERLLLLVSH